MAAQKHFPISIPSDTDDDDDTDYDAAAAYELRGGPVTHNLSSLPGLVS